MRLFWLSLVLSTMATLAWSQELDTFVLEIQGLEPGIDVLINGNQLGFTPFSQALPRVETKLELRHADWEPYSVVIPIPATNKVTINPQLIHSRPYELKTLKEWRERLAASLTEKQQAKATWDSIGIISVSTIGGGVLVAGTGAVAATVVEPQYHAASNTTDATTYRSQLQTWNTVFNIGLFIGIAGVVSGVVTLIFTPDLNGLQAQIDSIDRQIRSLEISP